LRLIANSRPVRFACDLYSGSLPVQDSAAKAPEEGEDKQNDYSDDDGCDHGLFHGIGM
jgi:hypothetical protein